MDLALALDLAPQPDDTTCGPTCLHALYRYYGDEASLPQVIAEVPTLADGGTLGVLLANHALARGYRAVIYSYNLQLFDPSWFGLSRGQLAERLRAQAEVKSDAKLRQATAAYLDFLEAGGQLRFDDVDSRLIRRHLEDDRPLLTGLSATWLWRARRERPGDNQEDDLRGEPVGHFVLLTGFDRRARRVRVADPMHPNPIAPQRFYEVQFDHLIASIFLGALTYDANLLAIEPPRSRR